MTFRNLQSGKKIIIHIDTGDLEFIATGLKDLADAYRKTSLADPKNWDFPEQAEEYAKENERLAAWLESLLLNDKDN